MRNESKSDRLNLRVTSELRRLLQVAADLEDQNLSAFVLEAARLRAEQRLADQDRFALPRARLAKFMQALERSPRALPRLQRLMNEETILERAKNAPRTGSSHAADSADEL